MEDNKNNVSNQNNTVSQTPTKSNVNNALVIIIIVLVILLGIAGYFLFIKNGDGKTPGQPTSPPTIPTNEPNKSQVQEDNNKEETKQPPSVTKDDTKYELADNTIYTSKDGKEKFTITKVDVKEEDTSIRAKYKDKMYTFYASDYSYVDYYLSVEGEPDVGGGGQCNSTGVILNLKSKTLERISTTGQKYFNVIRGNDGYFFTEGYCLSGYDTIVYDNNWKKLGQLVGHEADSKGNIHAHDNGKIIKYNPRGNKISETSTSAKYIGPAVIYNNTLYYMGEETGGVYLYNNDTGEKYKISDQSIDFKEGRYPYTGLDVQVFMNLTLENNKIMINYDSDEYGYSFDINTKQLTKIK